MNNKRKSTCGFWARLTVRRRAFRISRHTCSSRKPCWSCSPMSTWSLEKILSVESRVAECCCRCCTEASQNFRFALQGLQGVSASHSRGPCVLSLLGQDKIWTVFELTASAGGKELFESFCSFRSSRAGAGDSRFVHYVHSSGALRSFAGCRHVESLNQSDQDNLVLAQPSTPPL